MGAGVIATIIDQPRDLDRIENTQIWSVIDLDFALSISGLANIEVDDVLPSGGRKLHVLARHRTSAII